MANNKKKTAAAKKIAALVQAGLAPPILPDKSGDHWVPDLSDPSTLKAFFNYAKKFGLPEKEVLAKILSVEGNKEVFKKLKEKKTACDEPQVPEQEHEAAGYPNTQAGALRFADENIEGFEEAGNISAVPSADDEFVWLVFNHDQNQAFVTDLKVSEVEVVDYTQSLDEVR